ncbi:MAG: response regulator transcription factor [Chloroflexi bacterium]|nr:response regulator transcription factor [Chloroflexota bacterium]
MRILIIEDCADVTESISLCLQLRWPDAYITCVAEGVKGLESFQSEECDIVILDLNLPDLNGLEVLKQLREISPIPIIIVTVRGSETDQVTGLEMGADDYIVKPFKPRDLVARVNAVLRRSTVKQPVKEEQASVISGNLSLNLSTNEVHVKDNNIRLAPTESRLLYILIKHADKTLSVGQIIEEVWGKGKASNELLRTYIRRLRSRLGDNPPQIIVTQQKEGYRFVTPN